MANIIRALLGSPEPERKLELDPDRLTPEQRVVREKVRLTQLKMKGRSIVAETAFDAVVTIDMLRREKSCGDQVLEVVLAEIEAQFISDVKKDQRDLYDPFS